MHCKFVTVVLWKEEFEVYGGLFRTDMPESSTLKDPARLGLGKICTEVRFRKKTL